MDKSGFQFLEAVSKYRNIALYIPGSPDPDAIASAYAVMRILKKISVDSEIFAEKKLSLPQNQAFIDKLKINVNFGREINLKKFDAYIVTDFPNNRIESIGGKIPCAAHIDHHGKSRNSVHSDFSLIRTDSGSTSTLLALIIKNLNLKITPDEMTSISTALTFGIQTDTDKYNHTSPLDIEALNFLSEYTDRNLLQGINSMPPSPETLLCYKKGRGNEVVYKDWGFYGIGYIDAKSRDSIAISADMILKNSDHKLVAIFALVENHKKGEMYLDVSLRTDSSHIDLNNIIRRITPSGGGRLYKGAYQIKLNYFRNTPDRDMLWKIVETTTVDTLKRSRDTLYITEIESIYSNIKNRILSFLKKDSDIG